MIGTTISHYKILEKLGAGGMGVVYRAEDTKLKRTVALKFLPPDLTRDEDAKQRFIHEAQAASALQHNNICVVHDIDETSDGQSFICMEYLEGETLKKKIERGPLKIDEATDIAIQIGQGLTKAHEHGIVHRDIKPANIIVTNDRVAKIVDFGLAKLTGRTMLTKKGTTLGTVAYMSPEQSRGEESDLRSDIWALGIVLYEMVTGQRPFKGDYENAVLYAIVNVEPDPPSSLRTNVPLELERIILKCLAKEASDRYQHTDDLVVDLRRFKGDTSKSARAVAGVPGPRVEVPQRTRAMRLFWAVSAILVLVGGALFFLLRPSSVKLNPNFTQRTLYTCSYSTHAENFHLFVYPGISLDGNWVSFGVPDDSGKYDLFFMNTSSTQPRRIPLREPIWIVEANVSPNGELILFGGQLTPARVISSDGGEIRTVVDTTMSKEWSPDGSRIGYVRRGSGEVLQAPFEIWSIGRDGLDRRLEWTDPEMRRGYLWALAFCWSPDAKSIGWIRNFPGGHTELFTVELKTGKERQLTFDKKLVDEPAWMSNGNIVFMSDRSGKRSIWAIPETGGEPRQVTGGGAEQGSVKVSGDGKRMLIPEVDGISELWVSDMSHVNELQIKLGFFAPGWGFGASNDLRRFAFAREEPPDGWALYLTDDRGENRVRLVVSKQRTVNPTFSPDGRHLVYFDPEHPKNNVSLIGTDKPGVPVTFTVPQLQDPYVRAIHWVDSEKFVVFGGNARTFLCAVEGGEPIPFFDDSTWARPISGGEYIIYEDFRKGREGRWIVTVDRDGKRSGEAKKLLAAPTFFTTEIPSPDGCTWIYEKYPGQWWKLTLPSRREERLEMRPPLAYPFYDRLSNDGKRIAYLIDRVTMKLVLLENVFE